MKTKTIIFVYQVRLNTSLSGWDLKVAIDMPQSTDPKDTELAEVVADQPISFFFWCGVVVFIVYSFFFRKVMMLCCFFIMIGHT